MEFAKKYALVPEDSLSKHVPTQKQMSDFDKQMLQILNSPLNDYEKVQRYYELLQKKRSIEINNLPWSSQTIVEDEKEEFQQNMEEKPLTAKEDYSTIILNSVPKQSKKKAEVLLQLIKRNPSILQWNEKGEMSYNNQSYPNSNLADLFNLIFTNRKSSDFTGKDDFLKALHELNVPEHYIKNKNLSNNFFKREEHSPTIQCKKKNMLTVSKRKKDKRLFNVEPKKDRWISY